MATKVLLVCGTGASSGFMAANARKAAKKLNLDMEIKAKSESEIEDYLNEIDVLLVAPPLNIWLTRLRAKQQQQESKLQSFLKKFMDL